MRGMARLASSVLLVAGLGGCAQVAVTSQSLVNASAQIADASTNAMRQTSRATTRAGHNDLARSEAARRRFVKSQYGEIKRQAALGGGDLDTLAYLMRVDNTQAFAATVQAHYAELFAGRPNAKRFLGRLYQVVGRPPAARPATG